MNSIETSRPEVKALYVLALLAWIGTPGISAQPAPPDTAIKSEKDFITSGYWLRDHPLRQQDPRFMQKSHALEEWAKEHNFYYPGSFPKIQDGRGRLDTGSDFNYYSEMDALFYIGSVINHLETGQGYDSRTSTYQRIVFVLPYYRRLVQAKLSGQEVNFEFYSELEGAGKLKDYVNQALRNERMKSVKKFFNDIFSSRKSFRLFD